MRSIAIQTEYITLGQFLKLADCIATGGHAKFFVKETPIRVNGEPEDRRGRKLRPGDKVWVKGCGDFEVTGS